MDKKDNLDKILGEREDHPSYGMIGFYRTTSSGAVPLFGSHVKHRDTIQLVIKKGHMRRSLNEDWFYGDEELIRVEMSNTQFADLITSLNTGDGVPCTIIHIKGDGNIPECPYIDKNELHLEEFKSSKEENYESICSLIQMVKDLFSTKKTLNKSDKETIVKTLDKIRQNVGVNSDFQLEQFQNYMNQAITESKGEIEAFFDRKLHSIANQAIAENLDKIEDTKSPIDF